MRGRRGGGHATSSGTRTSYRSAVGDGSLGTDFTSAANYEGEEEEPTCPLCIEPLDETDELFCPCPCGYRVCLFCYERVKLELNGLCPSCRTPYGEPQTASAAAPTRSAHVSPLDRPSGAPSYSSFPELPQSSASTLPASSTAQEARSSANKSGNEGLASKTASWASTFPASSAPALPSTKPSWTGPQAASSGSSLHSHPAYTSNGNTKFESMGLFSSSRPAWGGAGLASNREAAVAGAADAQTSSQGPPLGSHERCSTSQALPHHQVTEARQGQTPSNGSAESSGLDKDLFHFGSRSGSASIPFPIPSFRKGQKGCSPWGYIGSSPRPCSDHSHVESGLEATAAAPSSSAQALEGGTVPSALSLQSPSLAPTVPSLARGEGGGVAAPASGATSAVPGCHLLHIQGWSNEEMRKASAIVASVRMAQAQAQARMASDGHSKACGMLVPSADAGVHMVDSKAQVSGQRTDALLMTPSGMQILSSSGIPPACHASVASESFSGDSYLGLCTSINGSYTPSQPSTLSAATGCFLPSSECEPQAGHGDTAAAAGPSHAVCDVASDGVAMFTTDFHPALGVCVEALPRLPAASSVLSPTGASLWGPIGPSCKASPSFAPPTRDTMCIGPGRDALSRAAQVGPPPGFGALSCVYRPPDLVFRPAVLEGSTCAVSSSDSAGHHRRALSGSMHTRQAPMPYRPPLGPPKCSITTMNNLAHVMSALENGRGVEATPGQLLLQARLLQRANLPNGVAEPPKESRLESILRKRSGGTDYGSETLARSTLECSICGAFRTGSKVELGEHTELCLRAASILEF
eukprot:jgi/Mesen1/9998/ME000072S09411